jgi:hypothetical protein
MALKDASRHRFALVALLHREFSANFTKEINITWAIIIGLVQGMGSLETASILFLISPQRMGAIMTASWTLGIAGWGKPTNQGRIY